MNQQIAILLASYNGEQFIREQIDSILSQSCTDWHLYIRDDNSSDDTLLIEHEYESRYPQQITVVDIPSVEHGAKHNFWLLSQYVLKETDAAYIMFCDQDDVWIQSKIEDTFSAMKSAEQKFQDRRILVYTDLKVVDRNLKVLGNSFIKYRALNPSCTEINRIVVQNNATGCTTMLSRDLLEKAFELEDVGEIAMHDWWFSLVASVFGHIVFVDKPTILYRQHGDNVVGATKVNSLSFILKRLSGNNHIKKTLHMAVDQAKVFLNTYQDIPLDDRSSLESFAKLYEYSKIQRILMLSKGHYWKQGPIQIIGEYIFI